MFRNILGEFLPEEETSFPTIIEFAEARWGLNQTLFPTQKFIFKLIYGLPLDNKEKVIRITDKFNEFCYDMLTEEKYFRFLQAEGRINLSSPPEKPMHEIVEVIGRRGSKSFMASCLGTYEIYRLLHEFGDPHKRFNISRNDPIRVLVVSKEKNQARIIFNQIKEASTSCDSLNRYISNDTMEEILYFTEEQLERYSGKDLRSRRGNISAYVGAANAQGIRGTGCFVIIMDEIAHFITNTGTRSDRATYEAVSPSMSMFGTEGKKVLISSPWAKVGVFYDLYQLGMDDPEMQKSMLVVKIPTWGMNPLVPSDYLKDEFKKFGKTMYGCEYGAEFSDSKNAWLDDDMMLSEAVLTQPPPRMGTRNVRYFWSIDQAQVTDAFAVAIGHREGENVIVDYKKDYYGDAEVRELVARRGFNPVDRYEHTQSPIKFPQDYEDIVAELLQLNKRFPVTEGIMDQWSGVLLRQIFEKRGLNRFEIVRYTDTLNSDIYELFFLMLKLRQVKFYDDPYFIDQLQHLEMERRTKSLISVQAPERAGYHDDLSDAVIRLVWHIIEGPKGSKINRGMNPVLRGAHIGKSSVNPLAMAQQKSIRQSRERRLFS